jgi:hypothetical protein
MQGVRLFPSRPANHDRNPPYCHTLVERRVL